MENVNFIFKFIPSYIKNLLEKKLKNAGLTSVCVVGIVVSGTLICSCQLFSSQGHKVNFEH